MSGDTYDRQVSTREVIKTNKGNKRERKREKKTLYPYCDRKEVDKKEE